MRTALALVMLFAFAGCTRESAPMDEPSQDLLITGATVLVGPDLAPETAWVLLQGDRIAEIGSGTPPGVARRIDAGGLTLLPGFIDAHVHIRLADPADVVAGGVTTVRDLAWPPADIFPLVRASEEPGFEGPRIIAAGPMHTVPWGYPTRAGWAPPGTGAPISDPAEAAAAVRTAVDQGAAVIKVALNPAVGPTLSRELLEALVTAAHEAGLKTTGHVAGLDELDKALDAGLDELAHMLMSPEAIPDAVLARMVKQRMTVVPTLSIRFLRDRKIAIDNLRRFVAAGGNVVYGTDLGNQGPRPGIDPREIKAMSAAGMTGRDIIRSATSDAAEWLGLDQVGVVSQGFAADLIGVAGDPLASPKTLTKVALVIRGGRVIKAP